MADSRSSVSEAPVRRGVMEDQWNILSRSERRLNLAIGTLRDDAGNLPVDDVVVDVIAVRVL